MLDEAGLREAMPIIAATGLPFLGACGTARTDRKTTSLRIPMGASTPTTWHSRPDEAEARRDSFDHSAGSNLNAAFTSCIWPLRKLLRN